MTEKMHWSTKVLMWIFVVVLVLALCSIGLRVFTHEVLIEKMGLDNRLCELIFFDKPEYLKGYAQKRRPYQQVDIDWEALYPYDEAETPDEPFAGPVTFRAPDRWLALFDAWKEHLVMYSAENLAGYHFFVERAREFDWLAGWNYTGYSAYNAYIQLDGEYLVGLEGQWGSSGAEDVISMAELCRKKGIDYLCVSLPNKISKYDDPELSGVIDFSEQNSDQFVAALADADVECLDVRNVIYENGFRTRDLFYRTDHHWKAETGFWAAQLILNRLNESYGYDFDTSALEPENFDFVVYPERFLGSLGRKATLSRVAPDDFTLIYPKYETQFRYEVPGIGIDKVGDFSVIYDMSEITEKNYYNASPYHAYNYGDQPLNRIENLLEDNGYRMLIIHKSFADCVIPFLALSSEYVDAIDLRHFTGNVEAFIDQTKPDIIITI